MSRVAAMPPDLAQQIRDLKARVDSLERAQPQATTPVYPTGLTWTAPTDAPIRGSKDLRIESLWADTASAVAADTTWELRRNGAAVGSVTVLSGGSHGHANLDPPVVADVFDVFTVACTIGAGEATVRALGRSSSPDSPATGGNGCSPVPGGSLQCDSTIGQIADGGTLTDVNVTRTSGGFDQWLTSSGFSWVAARPCTVFASFSALVNSGGTTNTLTLEYGTGPYASGVSATAGDGVTLTASDVIEVAAGDSLRLKLNHNGGGNADVVDARFNVLIVCSAAGEAPPN